METTSATQSSSPQWCPIRPWPIPNADRGPKDISEYISLVNRTYPGGFRAVNVDKIKEGAKEGDGQGDTEMDDADAGDEEDTDATVAKDPLEARNEALFNIVYAACSSRALRDHPD